MQVNSKTPQKVIKLLLSLIKNYHSIFIPVTLGDKTGKFSLLQVEELRENGVLRFRSGISKIFCLLFNTFFWLYEFYIAVFLSCFEKVK